MSIVIFGDSFTFPEGNAATNRIYTYARGFIENNVNTYIICNKNEYLTNGNGNLEGIQYFNPLNQLPEVTILLYGTGIKLPSTLLVSN